MNFKWDNDKTQIKISLCLYKNKIDEIGSYSLDLNTIENILENIQHFLESWTFTSISSKKRKLNISGIRLIMIPT